MKANVPGPKSGQIVKAIGTVAANAPLADLDIRRRLPDNEDIVIEIDFCGVCHSDIHMAKNEWLTTLYPVVPGHEIVGHVESVGANVIDFKVGDRVGVGVFVDTCRTCINCKSKADEYCERGIVLTYGSSYKKDDNEPTLGGYSDKIVVDHNYVFKIPDNLAMHEAAPLLCAGITVYSPLKRAGVGAGMKVAVAGLGGLGHMAVKFAVAMGAECTVLSRSEKKKDLAKQLGAHHYIATSDGNAMKLAERKFNVIVDTISATHNVNELLNLLDLGGSLVLVGLPAEGLHLNPFPIAQKRLIVTGSIIGSIEETKNMLKFCSEKNITCQVEVIKPNQINNAFERTEKGDVHFRFVIDMKHLRRK